MAAVTKKQLMEAMPALPDKKADEVLPYLNAAMLEFDITNPLRQAAFLAQVAHESGQLRWMEEIWGPTPEQAKYEGRKDLGNVQPGDGRTFRGRGPIQITGRANYGLYGKRLNLPLTTKPDLVSEYGPGFRVAGCFWKNKGLNERADKREFREITIAINGGLNGWDDRLRFYNRAKETLGVKG